MALNTFVIACKEHGTDSEILVDKKNCLLYKKKMFVGFQKFLINWK